jgi:hypothetical protein
MGTLPIKSLDSTVKTGIQNVGCVCHIPFLVGGLEHEFNDFPYFGNFIIPTDELIFFRGVAQPPSSFAMVTNT